MTALPGNRLLPLLPVVLLLLLTSPVRAGDDGSVGGPISVSRTKIKTGGAKGDGDVVVYLESVEKTPPPPPGPKVQMDQKGLVFLPHVLPVTVGTIVTFLNSDNELHNVYFLDEGTGKTLDIGTYGPGIPVDHPFTEAGSVVVLCKLHLEMAAYVVVLGTPYYSKVSIEENSQEGSYSISGVPPGRYRLHAWHKKLKMKGGERDVTVEAGKTVSAPILLTKAKYAD